MFQYRIIFLVFFLLFFNKIFIVFAETPAFTVLYEGGTYINTTDDSVLNGSLLLVNIDDTDTVVLHITSDINGYNGWFISSEISKFLLAGQNGSIDFFVNIPEGVCEDLYVLRIYIKLADYGSIDGSNSGMMLHPALGIKILLNVESGIPCIAGENIPGLNDGVFTLALIPSFLITVFEEFNKIVYYDFNGDQIYNAEDNDAILAKGIVYLYDSNDVLISSTNLAESMGRYIVPSYILSSTQDFYIVVETDKWDYIDPSIKDTLWEGNLFVDRKGSYASQQNVYLIEDVSSFSEITHNIDLRSRNTDQSGTWDAGSITVGPDDKDQIISPIHWDQLVAGTDFPYVDLDHDGRIDPDDKDHIISPLYWDFPN